MIVDRLLGSLLPINYEMKELDFVNSVEGPELDGLSEIKHVLVGFMLLSLLQVFRVYAEKLEVHIVQSF